MNRAKLLPTFKKKSILQTGASRKRRDHLYLLYKLLVGKIVNFFYMNNSSLLWRFPSEHVERIG
jgi:hypothetical protein